jgi:hypothetical protein
MTPQSIDLPVGEHALVCENPSGARLERTVAIRPGEDALVQTPLATMALLTPHLVRGDAIRVDGDAASAAPRRLASGRRKISLEKAGQIVDTRWVDLPPSGCKLLDDPELHCENP